MKMSGSGQETRYRQAELFLRPAPCSWLAGRRGDLFWSLDHASATRVSSLSAKVIEPETRRRSDRYISLEIVID